MNFGYGGLKWYMYSKNIVLIDMSKTRSKKTSEVDSDISDLIREVMQSDVFKSAIAEIIRQETQDLSKTIEDLRNEIVALKDVNHELINKLSKNSSDVKQLKTNGKNDKIITVTTNTVQKPQVGEPSSKNAGKQSDEGRPLHENMENRNLSNNDTHDTQLENTSTSLYTAGSQRSSRRSANKFAVFGSGPAGDTNFAAVARRTWIYLADKYKHIIENKKTDGVTWREKEKIWKQIEIEFNSITNGLSRTARQLKMKYDSIKKDLKKKNANHKMYVQGTGGGEQRPSPKPYCEEENQLLATISVAVEGLNSETDSDALYGITGIPIEEEPEEPLVQEIEDVVVEWTPPSTKLLRTPVHEALQPKK
ncbi:unnamed protein product, partial [Callosobruchus maculatus]